MLPDFFFCSLFPVQQTTSGIGHRSFFGLATNTLNVRNNNNNNNNNKQSSFSGLATNTLNVRNNNNNNND